MKTITIILLCVLGILAFAEFAQSQNLCDKWGCQMDCIGRGLDGDCDYDDMCRCGPCVYRHCRRFCLQQGRVGQCDETECLCL